MWNRQTVLPEHYVRDLQSILWYGRWSDASKFLDCHIQRNEVLPNIYFGLGQGQTILHLAITYGAPVRIIRRLIQVIDRDFCFQPDGRFGNTPIHCCLKRRTIDFDSLLLLAHSFPQALIVRDSQIGEHSLCTPIDLLMTRTDCTEEQWAGLLSILLRLCPRLKGPVIGLDDKSLRLLRYALRTYYNAHGNIAQNLLLVMLEKGDLALRFKILTEARHVLFS